jgi:hypothetical protein
MSACFVAARALWSGSPKHKLEGRVFAVNERRRISTAKDYIEKRPVAEHFCFTNFCPKVASCRAPPCQHIWCSKADFDLPNRITESRMYTFQNGNNAKRPSQSTACRSDTTKIDSFPKEVYPSHQMDSLELYSSHSKAAAPRIAPRKLPGILNGTAPLDGADVV